MKNKIILKKHYEELFNIDELNYLYDENGFYIIKNKINKKTLKHKKILSSRVSNFNYQKPKEIIALLKKLDLFFEQKVGKKF